MHATSKLLNINRGNIQGFNGIIIEPVIVSHSFLNLQLSCNYASVPEWNAQNIIPSRMLITRGLTRTKLIQEIDEINNKLQVYIQTSLCMKITRYALVIPIILLFTGFILCACAMHMDDYNSEIKLFTVALVFLAVGFVCLILLCGYVGFSSTQKFSYAMDSIKQYINVELNEVYKIYRISWELIKTSMDVDKKSVYYDWNMHNELQTKFHTAR
eukprot:56225_1